MKRLFFLNRYFSPDHSATSQILSPLAFHLAASGMDVHVITSQQIYDDPDAYLPTQDVVNGVKVHRVLTTQFGRTALVGRAMDYLSFYVSAGRCLLAHVERNDILVAMTDPPLISIVAMQVARRRRARLVNWLQDIYPEVAVQLGVPFVKGPILSGISYLRDRCLKAAAANVALGELMVDKVAARGVSPDRIHLIPNWADEDSIFPVAHADNPLRQQWGLEGRFVVGYSGNLGRAHEFNTVLEASQRLKDHPAIVFVCVGGGHRFDELIRCVKERGVDRLFRFIPYQDRTLLKYSLSVPDVHWISLKPELEGLIVPSKFYGVAAAGRPMIAITAKDGEIARLIRQHQCGLVIEPGDADRLAEQLVYLSSHPECNVAMGKRARAMLEAHFTRQQAFERWRGVLDNVAYSTQSG